MKTAQDILMKNIGMIPIAIMNDGQRKSICEAINEARKDLLIELARPL